MRLKRRLARERAVRREAEKIAERATRQLYDKQQLRLHLLAEVVTAVHEASGIETAIATVLEAICRHCAWPLGHAWLRGADGELDPTGLWVGAEERWRSFRTATADLRLASGVGLPGQVLATRRAVWLDFAKASPLPRTDVAAAAGLRMALGFPILAGSDVLGVLEFFAEGVLEPDEDVIDLMARVGTELGRVLERQKAAERLQHEATHDALTGLPNRALIREELRRALSRLRRRPERHTAVFFIDLVGFKFVNDTLGHAGGDRILRDVAARLGGTLRPHDLFGRLGGDEFVIVCEELTSDYPIATIAERIGDALREPFSLDGELFQITASIGVTSALPDKRPEEVIAEADAAMYRAKELRSAGYEVYSDELGAQLRRRSELERSLRRVAGAQTPGDELRLHYQPVVDLRRGRIVGVEALLRWQHDHVTVMPAEFIPLAEETGLIVPIGRWVLDQALRQTRAWERDRSIDEAFRMSVNLSVRQLADPELMMRVAHTLARHELDPSKLVLEVTESVILDDSERGLTVLAKLRQLGVEIAIDDFGTGYASLSYLRHFPASALKIDRSFIATLNDARTHAIVTAAIDLAHALGLTAIAEGIETAEQLAILCALGCDLGQGYFFARPAPAETIEPLLRSSEPFTLLLRAAASIRTRAPSLS